MGFKMPPLHHFRRISLQELKIKINKTLGPEKASQYFCILAQFFNSKLSKAELDRQVLLTVEKNHLFLHNELIWAIWTNATSKCGPPPPLDGIQNPSTFQRKTLTTKATKHAVSTQGPQLSGEPVWSNGCIIPASPRKCRSGVRDREANEKQNTSGLHYKGETFASQELADGGRVKASEHGVSKLVEIAKRLDKAPSVVQQPDDDRYSAIFPHVKRSRLALTKSTDFPADEKCPNVRFKVAEEADKEKHPTKWAKVEVVAPLGIPFGKLGSTIKAPTLDKALLVDYTLLHNRAEEDCLEGADLPDVDYLKKWMERIAVLEGGLKGVSYESAVCLNHALDLHLKHLIKSCIDLVQSRRPLIEQENAPSKERDSKLNETSSFSSLSPGGIEPNCTTSCSASLMLESERGTGDLCPLITPIDFKVAMDIKPHQLGENWPTLFERVSYRVFEQEDKKYFPPMKIKDSVNRTK